MEGKGERKGEGGGVRKEGGCCRARERLWAREREWRREMEEKGGIESGVMEKEERERGKGIRGVRVYGCTDACVCVCVRVCVCV